MTVPVKRSGARRDRHRKLIARNRPACHLCGEEIDYDTDDHLDPMSFTIDHIIPLAKGGADHIDNIAAAHRKCNRDKSDGPRVLRLAVAFVTERRWS